jgi:hypothetical protein
MKKMRLIGIILCLTVLVGCGKPIMPPIEYNKPIDFQIDRNAVLYWEMGQQNASTLASVNQNSIAGSLVESIDRQNNPSKYLLSYGTAEQAIFITSFQNILEKQRVFKSVELVTDPNRLNPKDVFIKIYFRTTRVSSPERGYRISLSVDMSVQGAGKPKFTRTYFVSSDANSFGSFPEQQNKVSIKLAENLVAGLKQWDESK